MLKTFSKYKIALSLSFLDLYKFEIFNNASIKLGFNFIALKLKFNASSSKCLDSQQAAILTNNSILFLGELGELESVTVNMPYNLKGNVDKMNDEGNNYTYIRFSEILEELGVKGYTDVIVIDLSCSAGWDDREGRILTRQSKMQKIIYGGKRKKTRVNKSDNKRKRKRTHKKRK